MFELVKRRVVTLVNVGELGLKSIEFVLVLRLSILQLLKFCIQLREVGATALYVFLGFE